MGNAMSRREGWFRLIRLMRLMEVKGLSRRKALVLNRQLWSLRL